MEPDAFSCLNLTFVENTHSIESPLADKLLVCSYEQNTGFIRGGCMFYFKDIAMIRLYFLAAHCVDGCLHLGNDIYFAYGSIEDELFCRNLYLFEMLKRVALDPIQ